MCLQFWAKEKAFQGRYEAGERVSVWCFPNPPERPHTNAMFSRESGANESHAEDVAPPIHDDYTFAVRMSPVDEQYPPAQTPAHVSQGVDDVPIQYHSTDEPPDASVRSQITVAPLVCESSNSRGGYEASNNDAANFHPLQLPPLAEVSRLLQRYFDVFDPEYPFLRQGEIETRLPQALAELGCPPNDEGSPVFITVTPEASSSIALVCAILALGQNTVDASSRALYSDEAPNHLPGYIMHDASRKLLQAFDGLQRASLDTVRCHLLNCIYALHANMVEVALQLYATAARLLTVVDPPKHHQGRQEQRSAHDLGLWWSVFILDRTLSRISDAPYILRINQLPTEIQDALDGALLNERACIQSQRPVPIPGHRDGRNEASEEDIDIQYLQVMGHLCHLWSSFQDKAYSNRTPGHHCSLKNLAILDTELQIFDASIPSALRWEPPQILESGTTGAKLPDTYRRLSIMLVSMRYCNI